MNSLKIFALLGLLGSLMGCSVYKSTGRKSFESRSPEAVRSLQTLSSVCWNQPLAEPLWEITEDKNLIVTKISEDEIQVCTSEGEPSP